MSSRPTRGAARLAAILDALPDALLLVNSNGTVVDANNAAVRSMQTPGTSLVGMGVLDLLPEFDPSRIPGSMRPAPRDQDEADLPVRMTARRTDGSTFPVEVSGNDFADENSSEGRGYALSPLVPYDLYRATGSRSGTDDLLLLLVRDLSSRLGVEAELRRQHKQTEMILRAAAEGVLGVDLEGRVVLVNPAAAHILDFRASELGGRELHPLIQHSRADGTPLAAEESALLDTLTSGRKHRVRGATLWRKDGRAVTVDLTTAPVRDGDQLVGAVMTFTDRTRELALTARNEHLTAVLETEVSGALAALRRRIDTLAADPAGQLWPEANWTLRALADECRRFGVLIDGVLAHQRFERGADTAAGAPASTAAASSSSTSASSAAATSADASEGRDVREPRENADGLNRGVTTLDKLVDRAVELAGQLVGTGRLRFSVHAAPVEVTADHERLAQALAHLVADVSGIALTATPPGPDGPAGPPTVVLAAAQRGEVARIEVRGPGRGGSRVHLPIALGLVERHGGVLQPHELPNHAGTTYVVELPLDPAAARAAAARAASGAGRLVPRETDTAVLPDLPGVPELTATADGVPPVAEDAAAEEAQSGGRAARLKRAAQSRAAQNGPSLGPLALGPGPSADASAPVPAAAAAEAGQAMIPAQAHAPEPRTPFALGPGPTGAVGRDGVPGEAESAPDAGPGSTSAGTGPGAGQGAAQGAPGSRRRRALPAPGAAPDEPAALSLPGVPDPGMPLYPGLEHALPAVPAELPAAGPTAPVQPTGRRRRLGIPSGAGGENPAGSDGSAPSTALALTEATGSAAAPAPPMPSAPPAGGAPLLPVPQQVPVGSGLGELTPPRPAGGFASAFPGAFPSPTPEAPASVEPRPAARPMAELGPAPSDTSAAANAASREAEADRDLPRLSGEDDAAPAAGPNAAPRVPEYPDYPTMVSPAADGRPRRLLVWPEPDASTKQALQERGYRPVIVRSREEVDAQVAAFPAALFVDPLTGPITRTALQSLRTAALNSRVPVLVTAGLGQATRDAAYGADPAVLLRALAPRDSANHAARVLLVESDPDIAAALISSLERRGMHVEHAISEIEAVSKASSVQPNLVVMNLLKIRRRRLGLLDWLRANDRLHRTPLVVYTAVDLDPAELPRLRTGETVLFLAERSTSNDVQSRIVDLLGRIGALGEPGSAGSAG
ncbi:PAS domain S-box-containing protein [Kitasatospora sp. MAP12-15]|uniref:PAS domain-containing protein n=1 Tax=unclassified Kitasatospora TaxID=2633591 RepID=UPI0024742008|nr:PAS domain-containing protein [Kitasatospora sp. MAP12-44]MDH6111662.1 PAS domain S-box-containing protein [Kitasatospora sp. MAP12-44]